MSAGLWSDHYDGWIGVGYQTRWRVGGFMRWRGARDSLRAGNDALTLRLPTDVFGDEPHVLVQGLSVSSGRGSTRYSAFAGASAAGVGVPVFTARRAEQGFGMLAFSDSLSRGFSAGASAIVAAHPTLLGHLDWRGPDGSIIAASGGRNDGRTYRAVAGAIRRDAWSVVTSLVDAPTGFRRASLPAPAQTAIDGVNVDLTVHPTETSFITVGRHGYLTDSGGTTPLARAHGVSGAAGLGGESGHGAIGAYRSRAEAGRSLSLYVNGGWSFTDWLAADGYVMRSRFESEPARVSPALMLHERVNPRLTLDQILTGFGGGASLGLGGTYIGRFGEYALAYQIVNDPFDSHQPFKRAATLTVRLQIADYNASVGTSMMMDGRVVYTASAERYLYLGGMSGVGPSAVRVRMDRYIVEGFVRDETGAPIAGAAIGLGDDIVFTDSQGHFFARRARSRPVRVTVALDQFIVAGTFVVVSAPDTATPQPESSAKPLAIVLRRR